MKRLLVLTVLVVVCLVPALAIDWKPISPDELGLQKPRVDEAADAEALSWEIWIADSTPNNQDLLTTYTHYLRVKIFTDRGVQKHGTVDLEYGENERIADIAGRTIQPDGSIQELRKDAIFDHIIEKKRRSKVHAVSFALPGVKAGSIIEYRWRKVTEAFEQYQILQAQREIPCEHIVFHIKPLRNPDSLYVMRYKVFNSKIPQFKPEGNTGFSISTLDNVSAYKEEEDAPPDTETRPWILFYYSEDRKESPDEFWKTEGKNRYKEYRSLIKVNADVKDIAEAAMAGAASSEDKLSRLYDYCRKNVKNILGDEATDLDRKAFKSNRNTAEAFKTRRRDGAGHRACVCGASHGGRI